MASIQDALKKSADRAAKATSKNRGLRPYDVIIENAEKQATENSEQVKKEEAKVQPEIQVDFSPQITSTKTEIIVEENQDNTVFDMPQKKIDVEFELPKENNLVETFDLEKTEAVEPTSNSEQSAPESDFLAQDILDDKDSEGDDFEQLLDKATEEASLKFFKDKGGIGIFDEYIDEKGWNKVPHSLQKWILKNFKGNDLKGMYYLSYLSIRNRSDVFEVGYSNISSALGLSESKTGPSRIMKSLLKKGVLTVERPATPSRATLYKFLPIVLLLKQDPEFFKRVSKDEPIINKDVETEATALKKYLDQNYSPSEVARVIPKYKFILEKHTVPEVIDVLEHVNKYGIFGIKPDKIGNIHSFLTSGDKVGETFYKAFNSIKQNKHKTDAVEEKLASEANEAMLKRQEDELFKFKAEQARQFIFAEGEEAGKSKLEELKLKYKVENGIVSNFPIVDGVALVYFYDQKINGRNL